MIALSEFHGAPVYVLGLGRSGLATAAALEAGGATLMVWDDNPEVLSSALEHHSGWRAAEPHGEDMLQARLVVPSPGVRPDHLALRRLENGAAVFASDAALLQHARSEARFIGITGTNGKSTVASLLAHMLEATPFEVATGGNLGVPALSLADNADVYILEQSSYQLYWSHDLSFDVAVFLNISHDHLNWHGNFQRYLEAKRRIFANQREDQVAVIARPEGHLGAVSARLAQELTEQARSVSLVGDERHSSAGVVVRDQRYLVETGAEPSVVFDMQEAPGLPGFHNALNAAVCWLAARGAGLSRHVLAERLRSFEALAHRLQNVGRWRADVNLNFIDDSKATNLDSTRAALRMVGAGRVLWLAGGEPKAGQNFRELRSELAAVEHGFFFGAEASSLHEALSDVIEASVHRTLDEAFTAATNMVLCARPNNASHGESLTILLSPCCPSFDAYKNFEERGRHFAQRVHDFIHHEQTKLSHQP